MSKNLVQISKVFLVLLVPLVIVLGVARLLATEPYLIFEYEKPDFPEDPFGFDRTQRLTHAADNLQFITRDQPLVDLTGQKHNDAQLYNTRELSHMQDVQNVFQAVWRVWLVALTAAVLCGLALVWRKENRPVFVLALRTGGAITVCLVAVIGLGVIVAWQTWFVFFHQVFFAAGSWTFNYSDTLIRLFPEKFWYDTGLTVASLSVITGTVVYWIGSLLSTINKEETDPGENEKSQPLKPATHQHGF
jgi:integral membrane protein (TIGR01906 family)